MFGVNRLFQDLIGSAGKKKNNTSEWGIVRYRLKKCAVSLERNSSQLSVDYLESVDVPDCTAPETESDSASKQDDHDNRVFYIAGDGHAEISDYSKVLSLGFWRAYGARQEMTAGSPLLS